MLGFVVLAGCDAQKAPDAKTDARTDSKSNAAKSDDPDIAEVKPNGTAKERALTVDTGDLDVIQKRKTLRVLLFGGGEVVLPRAGASTVTDRELAAEFAQTIGAEVDPIAVAKFADLVPMLLDGKGDMIVARLAKTKEREKQIAFSRPTAVVNEVLVAKKGDAAKSVADLAGKTVTVRKSSSYRETLDALPDAKIVVADAAEDKDTEALVHDVAAGKIPYTVCDSDLFEHIAAYTPDVQAAFAIKEGRQIGFGLRPQNSKLKAAADAFLVARAVSSTANKLSTGDLGEIKKRGSVRILTRNNAVSYFLHKGTQQGFDYELMKLFAKDNGLRLDVVVPPESGDLIPWLLDGHGDVIAAQMTATDARKEKVAFSDPYLTADEVLVQKAGEKPIASVDELKGKTVVVRKSSSYAQTLAGIPGVKVEFAAEDKETEELVADVAAGKIPLTVADSNIAAVELSYRSDVQASLAVKSAQPIAYGARKENKALLAALNEFVKKRFRGLEYNVLKKQYFENKRIIESAHDDDVRTTGVISAYDELVKQRSQEYGLDWRLMTSQAYEESHFDPNAKSWVGAQGLFQVMPATGKEMGFDNLTDPDQGIHAGVQYMAKLIDQFEPDLPFKQRVRFALASYNAGKGHVDDARRLATEMGLSPDKWFKNVEKAMLLLQQPKYSRKARHGYCRGEEPVKYVSEIQSRYDNYLTIVKDLGDGKR